MELAHSVQTQSFETPGFFDAIEYGSEYWNVSDDGNLVVGGSWWAFCWEDGEMTMLERFNWSPIADGISGGGRGVVGGGRNLDGRTEAYRAELGPETGEHHAVMETTWQRKTDTAGQIETVIYDDGITTKK